jgi:hypothetical protein
MAVSDAPAPVINNKYKQTPKTTVSNVGTGRNPDDNQQINAKSDRVSADLALCVGVLNHRHTLTHGSKRLLECSATVKDLTLRKKDKTVRSQCDSKCKRTQGRDSK